MVRFSIAVRVGIVYHICIGDIMNRDNTLEEMHDHIAQNIRIGTIVALVNDEDDSVLPFLKTLSEEIKDCLTAINDIVADN